MVKRKFDGDDQDEDPSWRETKSKKKQSLTKTNEYQRSEFISPYRKPLQTVTLPPQESSNGLPSDGSPSFHASPAFFT